MPYQVVDNILQFVECQLVNPADPLADQPVGYGTVHMVKLGFWRAWQKLEINNVDTLYIFPKYTSFGVIYSTYLRRINLHVHTTEIQSSIIAKTNRSDARPINSDHNAVTFATYVFPHENVSLTRMERWFSKTSKLSQKDVFTVKLKWAMKDICLGNTVNLNWSKLTEYK